LKRFSCGFTDAKWLYFAVFAVLYKYLFGIDELFGFIARFFAVVKPFVYGFIIAYIINIPIKKLTEFLKRHKIKKAELIATVSVYIITAVIITAIIMLLFPIIRESVNELVKNMPVYYDKAIGYLKNIDKSGLLDGFEKNIGAYFSGTRIMGYMGNIAHMSEGVKNLFIAVVVSVYSVIFQDELKKTAGYFILIIPDKIRKNILKYIKMTDRNFSKYISAQTTDALIVMSAATAIMLVLRVKYVWILGLIIGILNVVPYIGSITSTAFSVLLTLLTDGKSKAIWLMVFLIILQQCDANFISVRLAGKKLMLNPIEVIFAIMLGGEFFGFIGVIFASAVFSAIKKIIISKDENETEGRGV